MNIQNIDDNEFVKWCLVRYLNPADHHSVRIAKQAFINYNFLCTRVWTDVHIKEQTCTLLKIT